jgi:hypothetical protein
MGTLGMAKLSSSIRGWKLSRRTIIVLVSSLSVILLFVIAGVAWFASSDPVQPASALESPTPTPSAIEPPPSEEPAAPIEPALDPARDSAHVAATFAGWVPGRTDGGTAFQADGGATDRGAIALRIESTTPAGSATPQYLGQSLTVAPSTVYNLSVWVQTPRDDAPASNVAIELGPDGSARQDLPLSPNWTQVQWSYTTGPSQTALPVRLMVVGPTAGIRIDELTAIAAGSDVNLVNNGSFETYDAPTQLATNTLIFATGRPSLGVVWRTDSLEWNIVDRFGAVVTAGATPVNNGIGLIPTVNLTQGYYVVNIVNPQDRGNPISASFIVTDSADTPHADARFGIGVHFIHDASDTSPNVAQQLGYGNMRTDATWSYVERTRGVYTFRAEETAEFKEYESRGMALVPTSNYRNYLYDGDRTPTSATGIAAFARYTSAVVEHLNLGAIEVYNEYDNARINKTSACGRTAECYLPLLAATSNQVRADHPGTTIVGPAIANHNDAWLTALYRAGGLQYIDAVSFHPYDYDAVGTPEFLIAALQTATARIQEYNNGVSKPIWLTELGWTTSGVPEDAQAKYLIRAQTISLANNVEKFFWYDLVNDSTDRTVHEGNFGLVRQQTSSTVPALAPKPAAMAQAMLIQEINGKAYASRDAFADDTYSYVFGSGDEATRVAWAANPVTVAYDSTSPVHVISMYGDSSVVVPEDGQVRIDLTDEPVFIHGDISAAE